MQCCGELKSAILLLVFKTTLRQYNEGFACPHALNKKQYHLCTGFKKKSPPRVIAFLSSTESSPRPSWRVFYEANQTYQLYTISIQSLTQPSPPYQWKPRWSPTRDLTALSGVVFFYFFKCPISTAGLRNQMPTKENPQEIAAQWQHWLLMGQEQLNIMQRRWAIDHLYIYNQTEIIIRVRWGWKS